MYACRSKGNRYRSQSSRRKHSGRKQEPSNPNQSIHPSSALNHSPNCTEVGLDNFRGDLHRGLQISSPTISALRGGNSWILMTGQSLEIGNLSMLGTLGVTIATRRFEAAQLCNWSSSICVVRECAFSRENTCASPESHPGAKGLGFTELVCPNRLARHLARLSLLLAHFRSVSRQKSR